MADKTTWKRMISDAMSEHADAWENVESSTLDSQELAREFYSGFGSECGAEFTVWTARRVYFPVCYDGSEWAGSVARNPDGKPTAHIGGGG